MSAELTPIIRNSSSSRVAVVEPTPVPRVVRRVQFISELGRLRKLREFYKQGKQEAFKHISVEIHNGQCQVQNDVDNLMILLDHNGKMLQKLEERQQTVAIMLKTARDNVRELKKQIQEQSRNKDILQLQDSLQTLLNKFESQS